MTDQNEPARPRRGRRWFLGGLGASGLAAAMAVFGRSNPALAAYRVACCNLTFAPSRTISQCLSAIHYVWSCWHAGYVRCQCCEIKDHYGYPVASAYSCS